MEVSDVHRLLEESLARPTSTPCTWRTDRETYIDEMKAALRSSLIEPIEVSAVASDWAQKWNGQPNDVQKLIAVAHKDNGWLLVDPQTHQFSLAYGDDPEHAPLMLVGFSSGDALAEWLG